MAEQDKKTTTRIDEAHESDAKKLVDKHMSDPNHVFTDEEIASIRVGVSGNADEPTEEAIAESEDRIADRTSEKEDETVSGSEKVTPWDVLEE